MQKYLFPLVIASLSHPALANNSESAPPVINTNDTFINRNAYIQNPWISLTSAGGSQSVSESQLTQQNTPEKWFAAGTWNFWGTASVQYTGAGAGFPNYAYGGNFFAQTGQVAGFAFGGAMAIINPFYATNLNGNNPVQQAYFLPSLKEVTPTEAFVEYQYRNIVQLDAGLIGINNSPWLTPNYFNNMMTIPYSYQGAMLNVDPGNGWLLTAIAFNAAQGISASSFSGLTNYNTAYDFAAGNISNNGIYGTSRGTLALGGNYTGWANNYNLRLWGYEFDNYGELVYVDSSLKFKPGADLAFNISLQGGSDNTNGSYGNPNATNALTDSGYGQISSRFVGAQGGMSYKWFTLSLGFNSVWGPQTSYGAGSIVSPYTYGMATDPLYTTPYMAGLVDMGAAGNAYKISPSFNFLNNNLSIAPAVTSFSTSLPQWNGTHEYDFVVSYSIPQIKGLNLFGVYAYQQVPLANPTGDNYISQFFISYLY